MRNVIITGPTGAIGHALINTLLENNVEIYAICRPSSEKNNSIPHSELINIIECDLADLNQTVEVIPKNCDVFYHLGWIGTFGEARNNMELQLKNIEYSLSAVDLAHKCGCHTFVGAGSQAEYGRVNCKLKFDTPCFPENGYGMAKLCAGQMSRCKAHSLGLKHIWARILSVYGPYDGKNTMIMSTIRNLLQGKKPALTNGDQIWDFLYAKDAGRMLYFLGTNKSKDGRVYVLGSGEAKPLKEYIEILRDYIDPRLPLGFGEVPYSEKHVTYLSADNSNFENDYGLQSMISFQKGIKETVEWYRKYRKIEIEKE